MVGKSCCARCAAAEAGPHHSTIHHRPTGSTRPPTAMPPMTIQSPSSHPTQDRYATQGDLLLVLNCGSSSIKAALFQQDALLAPQRPHWRCDLQEVGSATAMLSIDGAPARTVDTHTPHPYDAAYAHLRAALDLQCDGRDIAFVVHRVVHGGEAFRAPVRIDDDVLAQLIHYVALAPLHQPFALELIQAMRRDAPALAHYACFDTAFHHSLPSVETMLPLPAALREPGLRRYGFHGLSYDYLARVLGQRYGALARERLLAAHLGSGASLCAMHHLQSVATTMGFSPLDGLMMGTRCGAMDPGALLHLARTHTADVLSDALHHSAGLLGVSECSADPRILLQH